MHAFCLITGTREVGVVASASQVSKPALSKTFAQGYAATTRLKWDPGIRKDMIPQKESELHTKEDRSQGLARGPLVPVSGSGLARHRRCQPRCFPQSFREGRASSAAALARSSPTLNTPSRAAPAAHAPSRRRVGGGLFTPDEAESTLAGAQLRLWLVAPGAHAARCSEEAGVHALGRGGHCWQTAIPQLNLWPPSWDF